MVEGLLRLRRRLTQTIPKNVRIIARQTMEINADELVSEMKRLVPVEHGDLRGSIAWTWGDAPSGTLSLGAVGGGSDADLRITIYAGDKNAFYAIFQEFGTQSAPAQPFFFASYRKLRRRMKGRMSRELKKAIRASR